MKVIFFFAQGIQEYKLDCLVILYKIVAHHLIIWYIFTLDSNTYRTIIQ